MYATRDLHGAASTLQKAYLAGRGSLCASVNADGSLAAGMGSLSEVSDREIPEFEVGRGPDILSS
jgi:hypothetical protein